MNNTKRQYWLQCIVSIIILFMLPSLAYSHENEANAAVATKDKFKWSVGVTTPSYYNVKIKQAYGVNNKEDKLSLAFDYAQLSAKTSLRNTKQWFPDYDGFGIALDRMTTLFSEPIKGINSLPNSIYLHWASMNDSHTYTTKFDLSDKIKSIMLQERKWSWGAPCYIKDFVFALLPNGHAKLWLSGCDNFVYIGDLSPSNVINNNVIKKKESSIISPSIWSNSSSKSAKNSSKKANWDRVNNVYWNKSTFISLNLLDDYNEQGKFILLEDKKTKSKLAKSTEQCRVNKPLKSTRSIELDKYSPQYTLRWVLSGYIPELLKGIVNVDNKINQAWNEAKQKGLDEEQRHSWVIARLATLTNYPLDNLYTELKVLPKGKRLIQQYISEICD